jgi:hypothetical protein
MHTNICHHVGLAYGLRIRRTGHNHMPRGAQRSAVGANNCKCSWARMVGYGPFSLCVIHKERLFPSSGDINRLMVRVWQCYKLLTSVRLQTPLCVVCLLYCLLYLQRHKIHFTKVFCSHIDDFARAVTIYNVFGTYPIKPKPTHVKKCI